MRIVIIVQTKMVGTSFLGKNESLLEHQEEPKGKLNYFLNTFHSLEKLNDNNNKL